MSEREHIAPIEGPLPRGRRWVRIGAILVTLLALAIVVGLLLRSWRNTMYYGSCRKTIEMYGAFYRQYAVNNGGVVPPSPGVFFWDDGNVMGALVCPMTDATWLPQDSPREVVEAAIADPERKHVSYVFVRTIPSNITEWTPQHVIAFEPIENHGGGSLVLFGDGHVEWLTSNGKDGPADKLVADHAAGVVPLVKR